MPGYSHNHEYCGADPNARTASVLLEKITTGDKRWRYEPRNPGLTARDLAITAGQEIVARILGDRSTKPQLSEEKMKSFADAILNDLETARKMLDETPSLARSAIDGCSMLHHAAGHNRAAATRLLIERGADPNAYWTGSLHTPLSWAVTTDSPDACNALLECGAKLDLFYAAGMGRLDDVRSFFDEAGNVRPGACITGSSRRRSDDSRITELATDPVEIISDALYIAARAGRVDVALYLLDHGADPSFRGYMGASCFHWAYFGGGDPNLIKAVLSHGGNPNSTWGDRKFTPRAFGILVTAGWGWAYYIKRILQIDPSLAKLSESGTTPLHEAAKNGNLEVVKLLLERGADARRQDANGKTAMDLAAAANQTAVVDLFAADISPNLILPAITPAP